MGINVVLVNFRGGVIGRIDDPNNRVRRLLPTRSAESFRLIDGIDKYDNTVFSRLQMKQFLSEWLELRDTASAQGCLDLHEQIDALARRCETHFYRRFEGD